MGTLVELLMKHETKVTNRTCRTVAQSSPANLVSRALASTKSRALASKERQFSQVGVPRQQRHKDRIVFLVAHQREVAEPSVEQAASNPLGYQNCLWKTAGCKRWRVIGFGWVLRVRTRQSIHF